MENALITISSAEKAKVIAKIQNSLKKIEGGYLTIAGDVAKLRDSLAWKDGYKNLYDMTQQLFGMSRGTTHNLCSIYDNYGDGNYKVPENGMTVRSMLNEIREKKLLEKKSEASEGVASETNEGEVSETKEGKVSKTNEGAVSETKENEVSEIAFEDVLQALNFISSHNSSIKSVIIYYN